MATNKLYNQGNYIYGDLLVNSLINVNVKTSSLIAVNLINILAERYRTQGNETIDVNTTPNDMKNFISKYFNRYIYNRFYEILSNGIISSPYSNNDASKNINALWCYYYQPYDTSTKKYDNFLKYIYSIYDTPVYKGIYLTPLYYCGTDERINNLQVLNVSSEIDDNLIMSSVNDKLVNLYHKSRFNSDRILGNNENVSTYDGYDENFTVPNITLDKFGHINSFTNYSVKTPSWSDCAKRIYNGNTEITGTSSDISLNETINNFTMILFNFTYKYDSRDTFISIPVYTKYIEYERTANARLIIDTGFKIITNKYFNSSKLLVIAKNSGKTTLSLRLTNYETNNQFKVYLQSIVGYVVG